MSLHNMDSLIKKIFNFFPKTIKDRIKNWSSFDSLKTSAWKKQILLLTEEYNQHEDYSAFLRILDQLDSVVRYKSKIINFLSYQWKIPDSPSFLWQFKEIFLDEFYKFSLKSTAQPVVIYDCGANSGISCLYFHRLYPNAKIIAFEADPAIANICQENFINNNIKNISLIPKAVWTHEEGVSFASDGADGGTIANNVQNSVLVPSIRLANWLQKEDKIDMLKMDIEGAEVDVIIDCKNYLQKVDNLFIEYHSWQKQPQRLGELLSTLSNCNFRYFIKPVTDRSQPLINRGEELSMDLQLNIFAYQVK